MNIDDLLRSQGEWAESRDRDSEIVISSRARLARNIASFPFTTRMSDDERGELEAIARAAIEKSATAQPGFYVDLLETSSLDRKLLVERHLISRELEEAVGRRGVAIREDERVSIMVNEEDHLRIQALMPGCALMEVWKRVDEADSSLEDSLDYAFHPQFGYLTACPTNVGTGLRISVMLHLPALAVTKQIDKVFQAVARLGLTVRGLYGEGTEATGHFYQVSNQASLGKSEEELVRNLEAVVPQVVGYERTARESLIEKDRPRLEDRAWRAYGMLTNARMVSSEEAMTLLSALKMASHMGLVERVKPELVNELLLFSQPAHLQKHAGRELSPAERDIVRGTYLREKLNEAERS